MKPPGWASAKGSLETPEAKLPRVTFSTGDATDVLAFTCSTGFTELVLFPSSEPVVPS